MNEIIKSIFGNSIREEAYSFPPRTPLYLSAGYSVSRLIFGDLSCLIAKPKEPTWRLPSIKKQIGAMEKVCACPIIVELDHVTAKQRTDLIQSGVAFVSGSGQVFIPFWGSYFEERIKAPGEKPEKMTANAQLVFIYLCYAAMQGTGPMNLTWIAQQLGLPKATCSRAVQLLEIMDLVSISHVGTEKRICLNGQLDDVMPHAQKLLTTPVRKVLYLTELSQDLKKKIGGVRALSERGMLALGEMDGAYVISKAEHGFLPKDNMISRQEYLDFGGEMVELWKYDPALLSSGEYVDDISLILSLQDDPDERVQKELDVIRQQYGMGGK